MKVLFYHPPDANRYPENIGSTEPVCKMVEKSIPAVTYNKVIDALTAEETEAQFAYGVQEGEDRR